MNVLKMLATTQPAASTGITIGNTTFAQSTGATTITVNKPSGVAAGTLLIAFLHSDSSLTWTELSGWDDIVDVGGRCIQWRVADGTEGSTFTFTRSGTTNTCSVILQAVENARVDAVSTVSTLADPTTVAGVDVSRASSTLLLFGSVGSASISFNTPTGFTKQYEDNDSTAPSSVLFYQQNVSTGATGNVSLSTVGGTSSRGVLLSLMPYTSGDPEYISSAGTRVAASTVTVNKPAGTAENDLMVAFIIAASGGITPTYPSGWTQATLDTTGNNSGAVAYKVAGASEPSTYSFTVGGSFGRIVQIVTIRGVSSLTVGTYNEVNSATVTAPSITAVGDGILLGWFGIEGTFTLSTKPLSMAESVYTTGGPSCWTFFQGSISGATGNKTLIASSSSDNRGILVEVY